MPPRLNFSAFGDDSDEEDASVFLLPKKQLELNELKSKTFSHGITKKSKRDQEKEAEERKRREEEEALAKLNAELEEPEFTGGGMYAFGAGSSSGGAGKGRIGAGPGFVKAGGVVYEAAPKPSGPPTGPSRMPPSGPSAMGFNRAPRPLPPRAPSPPLPTGVPKAKGKRAMDHFLQEIKSNQAARENRLGHIAKLEGSSVTALAAWEHNPAGRAEAQAETTNLWISNLPSNVNEDSFGLFFAKYGPVGTVKIMWPRGDEEAAGARKILNGFVNFMTREDAAKALNELDGLDWGGSVIRVAWSKPATLPAKPAYDLGYGSSAKKRRRSMSPEPPRGRKHHDSRSRSPSRERPRKPRDQSYSRSRSRSRSYSPRPRRHRSYSSDSRSPSRSRSRSRSPPPKRKQSASYKEVWLRQVKDGHDSFVTAVAKRVKDNGKAFEEVLRMKEKDNPKFAFMFDADLPEYHLYKYALNSRYRFPTPLSTTFDEDGYASLYSTDSAEGSENERTARGKIGSLGKKRFESILRALSGKKGEIARAMEFAMNKAEAANDIADLVCRSLKVDETPIPRKVARLHLVSDILHNSASPIPNVWKYRLAFEQRLPVVFAHLSTVYQTLLEHSGKISSEVFRGQVLAVLEIWERWIVFTQEITQQLRSLFEGVITLEDIEIARIVKQQEEKDEEQERVEKKAKEVDLGGAGFKSSFKKIGPRDLGKEADDILREALGGGDDNEDLDGEAMDEDLDGEEMDGDDIDGEVM